MATRSNEKKNEILGMSYSTACHRLRQRLLFDLVCETNRNICFVCNEVIDTVDELSIEHKVPWETHGAEAFWDKYNLAFSHRRCNRPHSSPGKPPLHDLKPSMWWCAHCKEELPLDSFSLKIMPSGNKGPRAYCKSCRVERKRLGLSG